MKIDFSPNRNWKIGRDVRRLRGQIGKNSVRNGLMIVILHMEEEMRDNLGIWGGGYRVEKDEMAQILIEHWCFNFLLEVCT